jgi:Zn-dependent oligopeptidase
MKEHDHQTDQTEISGYFELEHTLAQMFNIYEQIFGA